jgi:glucosamine--fructose-6-phosphate aminotransferase (isomerizing)
MCGIIGIAGTREVAPLILDALKRLEYRGYDSAGVATLNRGTIDRRRSPGKLIELAKLLDEKPLPGFTGIGHTRWATHGAATERNAHPHATSRVALVHNGIIENFRELKTELAAAGHKFESETDTEVAVHMLTHYLDRGMTPPDAAAAAVKRLTGAFALVMIFKGEERLLIGARRGSPLAVGYGEKESYLGSDGFSLAPFTNRVSYLEDGDIAIIKGAEVKIYDAERKWVARPIAITSVAAGMVDKGNYRHFMASRRTHDLALRRRLGAEDRSPRCGWRVVRCRTATHHLCLRHCLLRRDDRQILVRETRPPAGGKRRRVGIALSRAGLRPQWTVSFDLAIGRNR